MSSLSQYLEQLIANWLLKGSAMPSPPASLYLGLHTADPLDDGSGGGEVSGGSYARQLITFGTLQSVVGVGTSAPNAANIVFPTATANWGSITHGSLWDAVGAGNFLLHWAWDSAKLIQTGDTWAISAGDLIPLIR